MNSRILKLTANFLYMFMASFAMFYLARIIPSYAPVFYLVLLALLVYNFFTAHTNWDSHLGVKASVNGVGVLIGIITAFCSMQGA